MNYIFPPRTVGLTGTVKMYLNERQSYIKKVSNPSYRIQLQKHTHHFEEKVFENAGTGTADKQNIPQLMSTY